MIDIAEVTDRETAEEIMKCYNLPEVIISLWYHGNEKEMKQRYLENKKVAIKKFGKDVISRKD